jgi:hypothetical protein
LSSAFPTVERDFLSAVLQAVEGSYEGALDILKESGLTPVGNQNLKRTLFPAEVMRALFTSEPQPSIPASAQVPEATEPWTIVADKPRTCKSSQEQTVSPKLNCYADGEYEYARHRTSATEHWKP